MLLLAMGLNALSTMAN